MSWYGVSTKNNVLVVQFNTSSINNNQVQSHVQKYSSKNFQSTVQLKQGWKFFKVLSTQVKPERKKFKKQFFKV